MSGDRQDRRRAERVRAAWSARFESAAGVVTGHVVDLSVVSSRMRPEALGPVRLAVGATGTLTLAFQDSDGRMEVISLAATMVRNAVDGIALSFAGLPESAARWLNARLLTTESRRRAPRVRMRLAVQLQALRELPVSAETVDLSAFGARVRTVLPLVPGARLDLLLPLTGGKPPMNVPTVVWAVDGNEAVLMFTNLRPRDFNSLGDYVASRLGPARMPGGSP